MNRFLLLYLFLSFSFSLSGQNLPILWTDVDEGLTKNTEQERVIFPEKYRSLQLNEQFLKELLSETPKKYTSDYKNKAQVIEIPLPDGRYETFWVWKSPVMAKGLAMKFPDIQTFAGIGVNDETLLLKMDI
ncbi:MAG: hypothetical protein GY705_23225, partial [Bacteroidetes bacterium]|nr:hypothetical protein [Bacteroidota bacterium]